MNKKQKNEQGSSLRVLKVGPKKRHLAVPAGWRVIKNKTMKLGDMCALINEGKWTPIDHDDIGMLPWQDFVIRNYSGVNE